jgi:hypothetical protein
LADVRISLRGRDRAAGLAALLEATVARLLAVIEPLDTERWGRLPAPGVWSVGKDVEHIAEATVLHEWIVRRSIGDRVGSRQPVMERRLMTTDRSADSGAALLRRRLEDVARLVRSLSDAQLDQPTKPMRASAPTVATAIELILIQHIDTHRASIEAKLASAGSG